MIELTETNIFQPLICGQGMAVRILLESAEKNSLENYKNIFVTVLCMCVCVF